MLGGLGYFHSQLKATYEVLKNFRHFYPKNSLIMINDAGKQELYDISRLVNATYFGYSKNLTTGNDVDDIQVMVEWIERFLNAVEQIREEYFILLEDDVLLLREVNFKHISGQMCGYNPNARLPENVTAYLKKFNPLIQDSRIHYGGCGGCILETKFFTNLSTMDWKNELLVYADLSKRFSKNEQSWYFNDCCLSFLCWRYGGEIVQNPAWGDLNVQDTYKRYQSGQLDIVHQYRDHFNKPYSGITVL
jgi:hypothetical protein